MKKSAIYAIAAGTAAIGAILYYKRNETSRLAGSLASSAKDLGNKALRYGTQLKDRLLNHVQGPNGEDVYMDMYDRQFYENTDGKRVYLETV